MNIRRCSISDADQVNLGLIFTDDGIASSCNSGNNALTSGIMASLFSGTCLDLMGSGLVLDLDPFAVHVVDSHSYGTIYQSDPPDTLQQSGETVAARIVTQTTPGGACGKWILNVAVGGLDTSALGLGGGNPFALILTDADAAFGCFDIDNAIVGSQLDHGAAVGSGGTLLNCERDVFNVPLFFWRPQFLGSREMSVADRGARAIVGARRPDLPALLRRRRRPRRAESARFV